jgi:Flp pilus assembly pilin Flp
VALVSYENLRHCVACVVRQAKGRDGQALGEFSLVLAFVALAAVVALTAIGLAVSGFYESFADFIT